MMTSWWGHFASLRSELDELRLLSHAASTNEVAKELVSSGFCGVLTANQSQGRGRLGRTWESLPGQGVALSVSTPPIGMEFRSWLPLVAGAAVARELKAKGVPNARVKWPNDVLIDRGKVAGILCEALPSAHVIIGIGLNVDFGSGTPPAANGRALEEVVPISHEFIDDLLCAVVRTLKSYCLSARDTNRDSTISFVSSLTSTLGSLVSVEDSDGVTWQGIARSLTREGHLVIEDSVTSVLRTVVASDITHLRQ